MNRGEAGQNNCRCSELPAPIPERALHGRANRIIAPIGLPAKTLQHRFAALNAQVFVGGEAVICTDWAAFDKRSFRVAYECAGIDGNPGALAIRGQILPISSSFTKLFPIIAVPVAAGNTDHRTKDPA